MREAFTFLYSRLFIETMLVLGIGALVIGRLRRRLRVSPDQSSRAPMLWLVNFTADARLHRRLRRLGEQARMISRGGPRHRRRRGRSQAQRLAEDVEGAVIDLDELLISSTQVDLETQRGQVRAIKRDVERIEDVLNRVEALVRREATDPDRPLLDDPIGDLVDRVTQIERGFNSTENTLIDTTVAASIPSVVVDPDG